MKHLINIKSLTNEEIDTILIKAQEFEKGIRKSNHTNAHVANLFFENSTRTKLSFEMAENKLHINKYDFNANTSSINKGEDVYDTINNLSAIGIDTIIMRTRDEHLTELLAQQEYYNEISFINAGMGKNSHPTQALLDFYTIRKYFLDLSNKTITIVGDIKHSRVAKSNIELLKRYNINIRCLAPEYFRDETIQGVKYYTNLEEAFENTDIIMALRIQKERIEEEIDIKDYIKNYQITKNNLPYATLLMHPGPVNKNIEIQEDVLLTQNARTILDQAKNGVYVRMAILDTILASKGL